jgi:putative transcriptional regulator
LIKPATGYLPGQFLIAMPHMPDVRFQRSVIYLCAHTAEGAMGLIVNKALDSLTVPELMEHLKVPMEVELKPTKIHFGGPVETSRGFVLHSCDYVEQATLVVGNELALTATIDVLKAIGRNAGPRQTLMTLGYAEWGAGQLDAELQANVWLHAPADDSIIFDLSNDSKWERALERIGVNVSMLSSEAGHA